MDWTRDLNGPLRRDYIEKDEFEALMSRIGVRPDTTVIFYGDKSNWWATYAFWVFRLFGHRDARVMDGGRQKWQQEERPLTREVPSYPTTDYTAQPRDDRTNRAFRDDVLEHLRAPGKLVDVRSPQEFYGERLHMTAPTSPPTNCGTSTSASRGCTRTTTSSPTAASASAAATPGLSSSTCSATIR